jgi:hypothetical protein
MPGEKYHHGDLKIALLREGMNAIKANGVKDPLLSATLGWASLHDFADLSLNGLIPRDHADSLAQASLRKRLGITSAR